MWIQQIILDGFKSYATRTVITDFDPYFNAITGLNGSGKSNILDAICFVLGITNLSQVRVQNLQELVYKQGQAGVTKASVTIVFDNTDKTQSPVGYEQYDQIAVTRQVVVGGRNKYLINGHNAQVNRVQNLFHSVQLNVNNPHFLIMQGRITKVLNMKPPEILAMIEEAAGTRMYELKKENALKTIDKKEKKVEEINRILNEEITPTLEKLRGERVHYIQWTTNNQELEKLQRFTQAFDYYRAKESFEKLSEVNELVQSVEASKRTVAEMSERLRELKEEIANLTKQKEKKMGEEFRVLEKQVDQLAKEVVKLTQTLTHGQEAVDEQRAQKTTLGKNAADTRQAIAAKTAEYEKQKQVSEALEAEVKKLQASMAELQAGLQSGAAVGLSADGEGVKTLTDKLMEAKREAATAASELKAAQLKIKHLGAELAELRKTAKASGKEQSDLQRQYEVETAALAELDAQLKNAKGEEKEAELLARKKSVEATLQELREKVDALRSKLTELDFDYTDPEKGFDRNRVKGLVASLIKVQDAANTTAIEVAAGGKLYNVVVDTDATGKLLLEKSRLKRRVTIIPLNKISAKSLSPQTVGKAQEVAGGKKHCSVALSLVGFDEEVEAAMNFVFGNTLVCRDSETAKRVTFEPSVRARSVTLDGDMYDPAGTLTGGSRPTTSVLRRLQELNDAQAALEEKEAELAAINSQLNAAQAEGAKVKAMRQQRETKSHAIGLLEAGMKQSAAGRVVAQIKELETKLEEANTQAAELKRREEAAVKAVADTEQKMAEFEKRGQAGMKDAEAQVAALKTKLTAATKKLKPQQQESEKLRLELEALRAELASLEEQSAACDQSIEKLVAETRRNEEALAAKKGEYETANASLAAKRSKLAATDSAISDLIARRDDLTTQIETHELEAKKREHKIQRFNKEQESARSAVHRMETQHPWITAEKASFGKAGTAFDFKAHDPQKAQEKLHRIQEEQNKLAKFINRKVMSMFEKAEGEYQNLVEKKKIIENDKHKLIQVIEELDQKKNEALTATYSKVNKDFGSIFSTLLPGTKAKLEPAGANITEGLEVRVAFGGTWKESLTELSGGQKSLLALSLILALLLFKPAPMYILDEIDAALDLSHTQNIGQMLRTHFAKSQFIIVSLKEGMFNNANVLFRTKFVEGVSTVTRTEPAGEHAQATKGKERSGKVN